MRGMKKVLPILLISLVLCWAPASTTAATDKVTCMLDWFPNPDHAPLYVAQAKGFFAKEGLTVDIMVPADPNDPLKLVAAGKVDFAISYQPSVITARSEGLPVVSIGALVQHPLSCILYLQSSGFKTIADLKGKRVGYSVEPLYRVLFEAVAEKAGLTPADYKIYRVGFNLAPSLLSGKVDAVVGAFRNYEAIQIELEGKKVGIFALEEHGIPDFYELVVITNPAELQTHLDRVRAFMTGLRRGIDFTVSKPSETLEIFMKLHPDLRDELNRRAFWATIPFFKGSPQQESCRWVKLQEFMLARGLIRKTTPVNELIWIGK
ncbi:MAG: ABC transporter substrate-binding protein [Deltaproteobacteria bacterium]|nr:ABC transporter substrate-binding protein [Deltaproteobacteria bacterium]MBW2072068.1 ABC transporter substrate-binding protein [Deltaproteobacteria bacterium]